MASAFLLGFCLPGEAQDIPERSWEASLTGELQGSVKTCDAGDISGAEVLLIQPGDRVTPLTLDPHGRFHAGGLDRGLHELHLVVRGCEPKAVRIQVIPGSPALLQVQLQNAQPLETTIVVTGPQLTAAEERIASAEAVRVVDLAQARQQTVDLGEVMSRSSGTNVQRAGGLGSWSRFSLNGFSSDQVRFFLDGVPLELAGFGLGLANVPVNLLERVEVYRGVVPVRFGADALGGAVNLVSAEHSASSRASASLQAGSFGTWRGLIGFQHRPARERGGFFLKGHFFGDLARNDYLVDVEVPDGEGRLQAARVPRFHDGYGAVGGGLEIGIADTPVAESLSLRLFGTHARKELQHNIVMTVPYGEVGYADTGYGAMLRYAHRPSTTWSLDGMGGYSRRDLVFRDLSTYVYDWYGQRVRERRIPGELGGLPADRITWQHSALARLNAGCTISSRQAVRISTAATIVSRKGDDLLLEGGVQRDPLTAQRELFTLVAGLEHELRLWHGDAELVSFLKGYLMESASEEVLPGGVFRRQDQANRTLGAGSGLRWILPHGLLAKASYEYATRLPGPDEIFGDGALLLANLALRPERSNNANLELLLRDWRTSLGIFRAGAGGFVRFADRLIVLLGNDRVLSYQNVYAARALGIETSLGWTIPGGWLSVEGNGTWQEFRNASDEGAFGDFVGDRIPNRPWLFANLAAQLRRDSLLLSGDAGSLSINSRYVHAFFRGWESAGSNESKQSIPEQLTHAVSLSYTLPGAPKLSGTLEVSNILDAKTYDLFGVQRPGRAFFLKVSAEL